MLEDLKTKKKSLKGAYKIDRSKKLLYLHFATFYHIWAGTPLKSRSILQEVKASKYYLDNNKLVKINGKTVRTLVLSFDKKYKPPQVLLDFVKPKISPKVKATVPADCNCEMAVLFNFGCKCGGK